MKRILFALLFLLCAVPAWAAVTVVQNTTLQQDLAASSSVKSFSSLPAVGNLVVTLVNVQAVVAPTNTQTDNQSGNSYSVCKTMTRSLGDELIQIIYGKVVGSSGTFTVTQTETGGTGTPNITWMMFEVAGNAAASQCDQTGQSEGASTANTNVTAGGANSLNNEIVFSLIGGETNSATPSGYTLDFDESANIGTAGAHKIVTSIETSSIAWVHDVNAVPFGIIVTLKGIDTSACRGGLMLLGAGGC